jgi:L-fuculose-phosphate aldolase
MNNLKLRREIIKTVQQFNPSGLSVGKSGNLSARTPRGLLITPTGVAYDDLTPKAIVEIDMQGKRLDGKLLPSSEWRLHCDIYRERPEVNAVVHVHSPYATAVACTRQDLPAVHYHVALVGGDTVRCADYATFGTEQLSRQSLKALQDRKACLLANHGQVALGGSIRAALDMAWEVEQLARL